MEGGDQEVLPQTISVSDQLEEITMKQDEGDGGGEPSADGSPESKDVESSGGQQNDNTSPVQEVCTDESVNETVANEPETEQTINEDKEKTSDENRKDETFENSLHLDDSINKDTALDSEFSDIESVITKNSSFKLDSVDLSSLVSLEEELVISDKENDIYINETEDGNEDEQPASGIFDGTVDPGSKVTGDGSDSGVEVNGCNSCGRDSSPALMRAFCYNSGGYTSSFGLEDSLTASTATPGASCDSSLISCYSTYEETDDIVTCSTTMMLQVDGDGTSEGGSESSSITSKDARSNSTKSNTNKKAPSGTSRSSSKKRMLTAEAAKINIGSKSKSASPTSTPINTCRPKTIGHQNPGKNPSSASGGAVSKSASRREKISAVMSSSFGAIKSGSQKLSMSGSSTKSSSSSSMSKSVIGTTATLSKARSKDSSMSSSSEGKKDNSSGCSSATVRGKPVRSSSMRSKAISGTDDGRWPSSANKSHSVTPRSRAVVVEGQSRKLSASALTTPLMESKASALEKYATLPRRRRCKSPDIPAPVPIMIETPLRSHSVSRDPSLNRAASLRKQHHQRDGSLNKSLPPYPRRRFHKTVIYHETSSQTALTASDVEKALAGIPVREPAPIDAVETQEQEVQVDRRMEDLQHLESQLKILTENSERQREELTEKERQLEQEKAERLESSQRLLAMLRSAKGDHLEENDTVNTLQALETYLQSSSHVVIKQQQEISELQTLCRTLKRDLEKSLAAQKTLLQQQQELEAESIELQEFLQAEKSTLAEALRDAETEIKGQKQQLSQKESELERQQEECKHLVRISEQRRQENLALQARLCSLEQRSRELLLQQGAAVSGAAVALSGLSSRLDGLVEQLVVSYNISEKDLEVVAALLVSSSAAVGGGSVGGGGDGGGGAGRESAVSRMMEQACLSKIFSAFTNTVL
ncbi:hypothetical protein C0J52_16624 [Blattella germanica]|nr:hypothetical protein C0J52_16624 [Blattella germanica]